MIVIISGTNRPGSNTRKVTTHVEAIYKTLGVKTQLLDLYRSRWHIELDIRSLKQTLGMHSLSAKTPEMVEKELLLGMAGYNLVRAVQMAAARQANLEPRDILGARRGRSVAAPNFLPDPMRDLCLYRRDALSWAVSRRNGEPGGASGEGAEIAGRRTDFAESALATWTGGELKIPK